VLQASRRLPGIRFEAQPPPAAIVLPRMDVASFVGYASMGPLDTPVRFDDAAAFAEIFGPDLSIAWDARRGEPVYAALGPAVRTFFRNGGRRCFVVRVADTGVRTTTFELPGLIAVSGTALEHALLRARSPGTWPDAMRVAVSIAASPLLLRSVSLRRGTFDVLAAPAGAVQPGDLIRIDYPGDWTLLATIASATVPRLSAQTQSPERERITNTRVVADEMLWTQPTTLTAGDRGRAQWRGPGGALRWSSATVVHHRGSLALRISAAPQRAPAVGSFVSFGGDHAHAWLQIGQAEPADGGTLLTFRAFRLRRSPPRGLPRSRARRVGERLELEVWTDLVQKRTRLGAIGFGRRHPRFLGDLPTDDALYAGDAEGVGDPWSDLWRVAAKPRFPLAGPVERPRAYFPVAASLLPEPVLGALPPPGSEQRRNGLERFRSSVFIDRRLEAIRTETLLAEADYIRYASPRPSRLSGLHSLLGVDEVTMVAVPDASQAGWVRRLAGDRPPPLIPPAEEADEGAFAACESPLAHAPSLRVTGDPESTSFGLAWTTAPGVDVEVEEATDAAFETATLLYRGSTDSLELGGRPNGVFYYRARYRAGDEVGPYAAVGPIGVPARPTADVRPPREYTDGVLVSVHRALVRMCAARGDLFALLAVPEHYREDAAIAHVASLRTSRTWPRMGTPSLDETESFALGFAALHHPWLVVANAERPDELRRIPPDGPAAGLLARRSTERGAWVAPANIALVDVVALSPELAPERRLELLEAQVNVVERNPRGFLALAADTLTTDEDYRQINVRRLVQLLRRLALRHGETYAFEPNGDALRGTVQRGFENVLGALFRLGAFAGTRPDEGFLVVTGDPPNTSESVEAGRLIVELRVAPSRPLAFLTIRLVRAGDGAVRVVTV
jgi:hypothetical protein